MLTTELNPQNNIGGEINTLGPIKSECQCKHDCDRVLKDTQGFQRTLEVDQVKTRPKSNVQEENVTKICDTNGQSKTDRALLLLKTRKGNLERLKEPGKLPESLKPESLSEFAKTYDSLLNAERYENCDTIWNNDHNNCKECNQHQICENKHEMDDPGDLLTELYKQDGSENIWSLITDEIEYVRDIPSNLAETKYISNRSTVKTYKEQLSSRLTDESENEPAKYHHVQNRIVKETNLSSCVTATHLYSRKGSRVNSSGDAVIQTSEICQLMAKTVGPGKVSNIATLIDSGCTRGVINANWLKDNDPKGERYPTFKIPTRYIVTGDGKETPVNKAVRIPVDLQGHIIELLLIVMKINDALDMVIGAKALFELEASVNMTNFTTTFKRRSADLLAAADCTVHPGETKTLRVKMQQSPPLWSAHEVIAKFKDSNPKEVNCHTVQIFIDNERYGHIQLQNKGEKIFKFRKNYPVGIVDLRSAGYFHVTRDEIQHRDNYQLDELHNMLEVLSDEETLNAMQEGLKFKHYEQSENKPNKDPYPWLAEDDERRTLTDRQLIEKLVDLKDSVLSPKEKKDFQNVLYKYRKAFSLRDEIGLASMPPIELQLNNKDPFYIRPYPIKSEEERKFIDEQMRKGCLLGYLKKGLSSYSSPIMLIPRKNSSIKWRLVTDFRFLNTRLVRLNPSIPLVRDMLRTIGESNSNMLSVIDLRDAFHTLRLTENSKQYCGITPYQGAPTYLYQRLGMGLSVSPAIWQNFIIKVLDELPEKGHHMAFVDDILIHSDRKSHIKQCTLLFKALIKHGLKISPKKCQFFRHELSYMGHKIEIKNNKPCVTPEKSKIEAIETLSAPTTVAQVRGFCGMVNYLSFYLKDLQITLTPIRHLTHKGVNFVWTKECQEAFEKVKKQVTQAPVLRLPNKTGLFQIQSDTSKIGAGGALFQVQDSVPCLIAYYSKKLPEVVTRYGITELEMLGMTCNIVAFKYLVYHVFFEVYVDHKAIEQIMIAKEQAKTPRIERILEILNPYNFLVIYQKGELMHIADFLSRNPNAIEEDSVIPISFYLLLEKELRDYLYAVETRSARRARVQLEQQKVADTNHPETMTQNAANNGNNGNGDNQIMTEKNVSGFHNYPYKEIPAQVLAPKPVPNTVNNAKIPQLVKEVLEAQEKHREAKAMEQKLLEPADLVEEGYNPIALDISFHGKLPNDEGEGALPMQIPKDVFSRKTQPLFPANTEEVKIVRRLLPKQKELNKLLSRISKSAVYNYNLPISGVELINSYPSSPFFKDIYQYLKTGMTYSNLPGKRRRAFQTMCTEYVLINNLLFKINWIKGQEDPELVLCITEKLIPYILAKYHDSQLAQHQGITRTMLTLQREFFFPRMFDKVSEYIKTCHRCQATKEPGKMPAASLQRKPMTFRPFERMSMDIKDMPKGSNNYKYILVMVCEATQYTVASALKTLSTANIFEILWTKIICVFNTPKVIICDQASIFTSKQMDSLMNALNIKLKFVGVENHGANQTERYIQSLNNMFKKTLENKGKNWPDFLHPAASAMNRFISPITQFSPYEMVFGRKPSIIGDLDFSRMTQEEFENPQLYMEALKHKLKSMKQMIQEHKSNNQELQRIQEERKRLEQQNIPPHSLVMMKRPRCSDLDAGWRKLTRPWVGPLKVMAIIGVNKYLLSDPTGQVLPQVVERKELKPYHMRELGNTIQEITQSVQEGKYVLELMAKESERRREKVLNQNNGMN